MRNLLLFAVVVLTSCRGPMTRTASAPDQDPPAPARDQPYVLVLGTAQDGGLPEIGCEKDNCAAARIDPARRRLVTSLLLCDPRDGRRWLFDCTPDVREQVDRARGHPASRQGRPDVAGPRPPLFDGIFLTHAHMGHYGGLLHLGRESYGARDVPTYVTPRMGDFLEKNGPWSLLVSAHHLQLVRLAMGTPVALAPDLSVTALPVPHRPEFSDTVGFVIRGPRRALLYLPDIDKWEKWEKWEEPGAARRIEEVVASVDLALVDGCFFAAGELPGRDMKEIPHPFITESLERLRPLPAGEREKIFFTHLNHSNPAADPQSEARRAVLASGMHVLEEGLVLGL